MAVGPGEREPRPLVNAFVVGLVVNGDRVPQIREDVGDLGPTVLDEHMDGVVEVVVVVLGRHCTGHADTGLLRGRWRSLARRLGRPDGERSGLS